MVLDRHTGNLASEIQPWVGLTKPTDDLLSHTTYLVCLLHCHNTLQRLRQNSPGKAEKHCSHCSHSLSACRKDNNRQMYFHTSICWLEKKTVFILTKQNCSAAQKVMLQLELLVQAYISSVTFLGPHKVVFSSMSPILSCRRGGHFNKPCK